MYLFTLTMPARCLSTECLCCPSEAGTQDQLSLVGCRWQVGVVKVVRSCSSGKWQPCTRTPATLTKGHLCSDICATSPCLGLSSPSLLGPVPQDCSFKRACAMFPIMPLEFPLLPSLWVCPHASPVTDSTDKLATFEGSICCVSWHK